VKGATGATDEELAKLHSWEAKLFNNVMKMMKFQTFDKDQAVIKKYREKISFID
jgi:hypothetical protein